MHKTYKNICKMKKISSFLMMFLTAALCAGFQSCSDDDGGDGGNNGTLEPPVYSEEAVKCEFTDTEAPYESLELTESGDYMLILRDSEANVGPVNTASPLRSVSRAGSGSNVKHGTYKKVGEKIYDLSDFGKIVFTEDSIQITPPNGTTTTYNTTILPKLQTSHPIDLLCRSWKCVHWRAVIRSSEGNFDKSFSSYEEFYKFAYGEPEDMTGEGYWREPTLEEIIISKYGTLALSGREYHDNTFLGLTYIPMLWKATGSNEGQLYFPDDDDSAEYSDEHSFKIEKGRLVLTIVQRYNDEDGVEEDTLICTYVENKH